MDSRSHVVGRLCVVSCGTLSAGCSGGSIVATHNLCGDSLPDNPFKPNIVLQIGLTHTCGVMKVIEIFPLAGAGFVKLGMSRAEVHAVMGVPSTSFKKVPTSLHPTDAWLHNGFQVFYGGIEPSVEFIELSSSSGFEVLCLGQYVFSTPASKLVEQFQAVTSFDPFDKELGYSYIFPAIELAMWRPDMEEPQGKYFSTVGIGCVGYFSDTNAS
ncbi:hypothetical protein [Xanthomonas arboricola]|uniref:hypothetical protein n=1 Tax=Xanthomonas arboricola TaxID=56448 RepID=UPI00215501B9|nr:hypothetical protein [Xanthomonas arboricola]